MKEQKLVVLGCGVEQIPLILEIKAQGIRIVGLDSQASAAGLNICDERHIVDIKSPDAINEVLDQAVGGILTSTEAALESTAIIASQRGLPGFDIQTVQLFRNKLEFSRLLSALGLPCTSFKEVNGATEILEYSKKHENSFVCKPADSSASRGVTILDSTSDFQEAFNRAFAASNQGIVMVQSFLPGKEFGIECFIDNRRCELMTSTDKSTTGFPYCVVLGHRMPSAKHADLLRALIPQVNQIIKSLNIVKAQINLDVIVHEGKAYIIDAGLRPGGNYLQSLIAHCYHFNSWQFYTSIFWQNKKIDIPANSIGYAGCQYVVPKTSGRLQRFIPAKFSSDNSQIYQLIQIGSKIHQVEATESRVAAAILLGRTAKEVDSMMEKFRRESIVEVVQDL